MDYYKFDCFHQIHPSLRKFVKDIGINRNTGIASSHVQILKCSSTSKNGESNDTKYANRFTLFIPYAGRALEWEVTFNNDDLTFAPDFALNNDDFLGDLDEDTISRGIPSWVGWDSNNPNSLSNTLLELINLYKKYQVSLLDNDKYSRILTEYLSLVNEMGFGKDDVEILVEQPGIVHFLISLVIDTTTLPPFICKDLTTSNDGSPTAVLMITFHRCDGTNVQPQLFLTPQVEQALGGTGNKHIPPFPNQGCLMDYVPLIRKLLEDKIKFVVDNYLLKHKYITQLLSLYTMSILEYDSVTYSKATLLFQTGSFHWLLVIVIGTNFPKEKPKWVLRSVYHMSYNQPYSETLNDYPYSPRWCPEEMIDRAFKYTNEKVQQIQNKLLENSQMQNV